MKIKTMTIGFLVCLLAGVPLSMADPPSKPVIVSASPPAGEPTTDNTIFITWIASTDPDGDLAWYATEWTTDKREESEEGPLGRSQPDVATSETSDPLEDGSYYFYIRAADNLGAFSERDYRGPFIITTQPIITSVEPASGTTDSATSVILTGTAFMEDATVTIGETRIEMVEFKDATELRITVPAELDPGMYDITVTNPSSIGGKNHPKEDCFEVLSEIQVSAGPDEQMATNRAHAFTDAAAPGNMTYLWEVTDAPASAEADRDYSLTFPELLNGTSFSANVPGVYVVRLTVNDEAGEPLGSDTATLTVYVRGDIYKDGNVTLADLLIVLQVLAGIDPSVTIQLLAADGKVDAGDAVYILQSLKGEW